MKPQRSRPEPRKMGNAAVVAATVISLLVLSFIKARYCSTPPPKPVVQLEAQANSTHGGVRTEAEESRDDYEEYDTVETVDPSKPTCYVTSKRSEMCAAAGDVRVEGNKSMIFVSPLDKEWKTRPYARLHDPVAMDYVREFTFKPFGDGDGTAPECTETHSVPAFLFSNGGFAGNLFHDYTDVLVPLFISTYHFRGEVQFLLSGMKTWWVTKFTPLFQQLSKYDIIDVDNDLAVHCFPRIVAGVTFHKVIGIDSSGSPGNVSIVDFKRVLRRAFGLDRAVASRRNPRLLIISRNSTRRFLNLQQMSRAAAGAGFDVRVAEPDKNTDMPTFARLVNSADVMVGVHGAGLTNMVFLPRGAVLIQVVPFGGLEWLMRVTFKNAAKDMDITYMDYNVQVEESSLADEYPRDHEILQHPYDVHKKGWDTIKTVYLDKQDVRLNVTRFLEALQAARERLP